MPLRFTTRDLLWLAALVAVCVAWRVDHESSKSISAIHRSEALQQRAAT
jgi:hypothetical protein